MLSEYFILYRNGQVYCGHERRGYLVSVVEKNPDFTEPENGKLPEYQIVRYVPSVLSSAIQF